MGAIVKHFFFSSPFLPNCCLLSSSFPFLSPSLFAEEEAKEMEREGGRETGEGRKALLFRLIRKGGEKEFSSSPPMQERGGDGIWGGKWLRKRGRWNTLHQKEEEEHPATPRYYPFVNATLG